MYKLILTFLAILTTYYLLLTTAYADSISLAVDPPIFQIQATAPANIQSPLIIENRGDSAASLRTNFKPFVSSDREDGLIKYVDKDLGIDVRLVDPATGAAVSDFELLPKQKRSLILSINVPNDLPSSDYYFSIIFLTSKSSKENISSSESIVGIASNVLLSVGTGKVTGEISEFSTPLFVEKGPVPFTVRLKNSSNHFINPKGEILIKNIFGQTVGRVDLAKVNILANSVRNIPSEDYFDEGKSLPDNLAAYWPQSFILGAYKANLSITLSDTGPLFKRSIFFFAFPLKKTTAVLIGILLLIYIFTKVKSKI